MLTVSFAVLTPKRNITSLRRCYQHHEINKCTGRSESVVSLGLQP